MSKPVKFCRCDESCPIHHAPQVINTDLLEALKAIVESESRSESDLLAFKRLIAKAECK